MKFLIVMLLIFIVFAIVSISLLFILQGGNTKTEEDQIKEDNEEAKALSKENKSKE